MGTDGLPFVLKELQNNQGHWFYALRFMAGESGKDVATGSNNFEEAKAAWLEWGYKQLYLISVRDCSWILQAPDKFENVRPGNFTCGSDRTCHLPRWGYNCIAWAAGKTDKWWWPDAGKPFFVVTGILLPLLS